MILAIFDSLHFRPSFESIDLLVLKFKIDFQDSRHPGFQTGRILAIFRSASQHDTFYQVSSQLAFWFRR